MHYLTAAAVARLAVECGKPQQARMYAVDAVHNSPVRVRERQREADDNVRASASMNRRGCGYCGGI